MLIRSLKLLYLGLLERLLDKLLLFIVMEDQPVVWNHVMRDPARPIPKIPFNLVANVRAMQELCREARIHLAELNEENHKDGPAILEELEEGEVCHRMKYLTVLNTLGSEHWIALSARQTFSQLVTLLVFTCFRKPRTMNFPSRAGHFPKRWWRYSRGITGI